MVHCRNNYVPAFYIPKFLMKGEIIMADIVIKSTSELKDIVLSELKEGTIVSVTLVEGGDDDAKKSKDE